MWRKQSQAVAFTLTEVFALLFFALALALAWEAHQRQEAQTRLEELDEVLVSVSPQVFTSVVELIAATPPDRIPDDFDELVRDVVQLEAARESLRDRLIEAIGESINPDTMTSAQLIDALIDQSRQGEAALRELARASGLSDAETSVLAQVAAQLSELEQANRDLMGQVGFLQGRGLDHPPCWADVSGAIEYAFEVTIHTDQVDAREIWPPTRNVAAAAVDGMTQLAGVDLSYPEFSRRALPILLHSERQEPECRHFVRIVDMVDGGKDPFKAGLLTVERFFYKFLVN